MKHIKLFEQFVNEEYLTEGKISYDKVAKALYGKLNMYKLKEKYKAMVAKYAFTRLDINGVYALETWETAGFKVCILEEVTTSASEIPEMDQFLGVKPGDMVTVITVPLNQGSELFSFVTSLPKGSAWMSEKSIFGSKTMYAAFKNMSQGDFDSLKSQFPTATIGTLNLYTRMKTKTNAVADSKKLKDVDSVEDSAAKY